MIAVDSNILVYAHHSAAPQHGAAVRALRELAEGDAAWAIPIFAIGEFLRVLMHPRGPLRRPSDPAVAMGAIDDLIASPSARVLMPGRRFLPLLRGLLRDADAKGNLVFDAVVGAVCLEHGASTILTNDKDFHRFPGITVKALA
ncbi:MAG: TA system VapC family ribonuclease toxin [Actinomycetota bacterium]